MDVVCPICGASFSSSEIEIHAEACIQERFNSSTESAHQGQKTDVSSSLCENKRKRTESKEDNSANETSSPSHITKTSLPSSIKKSRKEQAKAWSFLGNSGRSITSSGQHKDQRARQNKGDYVSQDGASSSNNEDTLPVATQYSEQKSDNNGVPLAEKMRPVTLDNYIGQDSILHSNSFLKTLIVQDNFINMILWGPPGCGKTSLANIIHERCRGSEKWRYASLSACTSGVQDVRSVVREAQGALQLRKKRTVLFMDEVHRFNKAQQDIFLPHVENGLLTLIGATTENPSFTLNSALLSRCRVITLDALSPRSIRRILKRALTKLNIAVEREANMNIENGTKLDQEESENDEEEEEEDSECEATDGETKSAVRISQEAVHWLSEMSGGDARCALSTLQILLESHSNGLITICNAKEALQRSHVLYDRKGDEHYNFASALQKSIRGGDDNAALYWTMRMIKGGEDPRFIARRLVRTAAEDIGLGTPEALTCAVSTMQAVQMLGMPESDVILAQCAVYLARAHHNPEVYLAMNRVEEHIKNHVGPLPSVPLHLRNAPTALMKNLGYGRGYSAAPQAVKKIEYMPETIRNVRFFD
ncbi:ATPase WRNIP1 [Procambarus clarkii]|uniref:ATPase WRNIP1 n=1 Tax=Procambarus clarkii TaxID=6728 RepID=UPI003742454A